MPGSTAPSSRSRSSAASRSASSGRCSPTASSRRTGRGPTPATWSASSACGGRASGACSRKSWRPWPSCSAAPSRSCGSTTTRRSPRARSTAAGSAKRSLRPGRQRSGPPVLPPARAAACQEPSHQDQRPRRSRPAPGPGPHQEGAQAGARPEAEARPEDPVARLCNRALSRSGRRGSSTKGADHERIRVGRRRRHHLRRRDHRVDLPRPALRADLAPGPDDRRRHPDRRVPQMTAAPTRSRRSSSTA
jgi:hypothetical protein